MVADHGVAGREYFAGSAAEALAEAEDGSEAPSGHRSREAGQDGTRPDGPRGRPALSRKGFRKRRPLLDPR